MKPLGRRRGARHCRVCYAIVARGRCMYEGKRKLSPTAARSMTRKAFRGPTHASSAGCTRVAHPAWRSARPSRRGLGTYNGQTSAGNGEGSAETGVMVGSDRRDQTERSKARCRLYQVHTLARSTILGSARRRVEVRALVCCGPPPTGIEWRRRRWRRRRWFVVANI